MTASSSDSDFANSDAKLNVDLCLDESNKNWPETVLPLVLNTSIESKLVFPILGT